jgi:hypothetical protein
LKQGLTWNTKLRKKPEEFEVTKHNNLNNMKEQHRIASFSSKTEF